MSCEHVEVDGLWICSSAPAPGCIVCKAPSTRLCDGPDPEDVDNVCSAALCDRHTSRVGEHDLCPKHAAAARGEAFFAPPAAILVRRGRGGRSMPREQLGLDFGGRR